MTTKRAVGSGTSALAQASARMLSAATEHVAASWWSREVSAADTERLQAEIHWICGLVARCRPSLDSQVRPTDATVLRLLLVDQVRGALFEQWRNHDASVDPPALLELLDRLEQARKAIEAAWRRRLGLAGTEPCGAAIAAEIAHGLRSSCAPVLFVADALAAGQFGELNDVQLAQLGILCRAATTLNTALGDLTDLAWGVTAASQLEAPHLPLGEILEGVVARLRPVAETRETALSLRDPVPRVAFPHPAALARALWNITLHRLLTLRRGVVEISAQEVSQRRIRFAVRALDASGEFEASPAGPPLTPTAEKDTGYAFSLPLLRLHLARTLVEAMASQLEEEADSQGAAILTFEVALGRLENGYGETPHPTSSGDLAPGNVAAASNARPLWEHSHTRG